MKRELEKLEGTVDSVVYKNEMNSFGVIILDDGEQPITVVGDIGDAEEGEDVTLLGEYVNHPKFGRQFKVEVCERTMPSTAVAIQRYLASGVIKGIGAVTAKKIVAVFGDQTLKILEEQPQRLLEVDGITPKKLEKIIAEFKDTFGLKALMMYISKYNISSSYGVRAWKRWGENALDMIKLNPYILCTFGVDLAFLKAEEIAEDMSLDRDNFNRITAGIINVLNENAYSGHTCLPVGKLVEVSSSLLSVDSEVVVEVMKKSIEDGNFYSYFNQGREYIYLRHLFEAESYIARRLSIMKSVLFNNKIDFSEVIDLFETETNIKYEKVQREAINIALSGGFMVITGGPGTGKTTTLNAIISLFTQQGLVPLIAAPTGRAAKRMTDLTGYEAKTIHRLLEIEFDANDRMKFVHDEDNLLDCDVIVVDEMSMVDCQLFEALLRAMPLGCRMIMVGDSDQLPSVGAGNLLKDIIESDVVPVVQLTEIFRQAELSSIVTNAHKIVNGEKIDLSKKDGDFFFFQRLDFDNARETVVELIKDRLPNAYDMSPFSDIQILSPTKKGPLGTIELNKRLQNELNPAAKGDCEVKMLLYTFRVGDKVMQNKNNYQIKWKKDGEDGEGIFNGDIGIVKNISPASITVTIDFDGRICEYNTAMLENVELAYAVTVHKSQGSEFDAVIIPVLGGYDKLYFRNLLYTAVTRAKKLLIIVGSSKRLEYMIANNRRMNRYTCLKDLLIKEGSDDEAFAN